MIQQFNLVRVLVEIIPEVSRLIWTPGPKNKKMLQGIVRLVGSQVESVKPLDKVNFFNEGPSIKEGNVEFRIINEYAVAAIINETQDTTQTNQTTNTENASKENQGKKDK